MRFSDEEIRRYSRQLVLADVGGHGQEGLRAAVRTACGEVEALYLAAAGVGTIIVPNETIAAAARALNPLVRVKIGNLPVADLPVEQQALFAWRAIKEVLAAKDSPPQ